MKLPIPAQAYWYQRFVLANASQRIITLSNIINTPMVLTLYQWTQLMAFALEFKPDLILELGRDRGNSTCAFTEVANQMKPKDCQVLSLCLSSYWEQETYPKIKQFVPESWFQPLKALQANILDIDYKKILANYNKVLIFWDAHGYEVAECVLGQILPELEDRPHIVIMHDLSDARYLPVSTNQYKQGLWKRYDDPNITRLRIGYIDSAVEQSLAAVDFTSRNNLSLHSADHNLHTELGNDEYKITELRQLLGDKLFSLNAHWFWFSLNEGTKPFTFPKFQRTKNLVPLNIRLKVALKILLNRYPLEYLN